MDLPNCSNLTSSDKVKEIMLSQLEKQSVEKGTFRETFVEEVNDVDAQMRKEQLKRLIADNQARKRFSQWIFAVTVLWMFCVLMIVVQCARGSFHLSDGVLIALITTTTANVFGFFYVVVNYLFNPITLLRILTWALQYWTFNIRYSIFAKNTHIPLHTPLLPNLKQLVVFCHVSKAQSRTDS